MQSTENSNQTQNTQGKNSHEEFERRPVEPEALLGFKNFIGMYAGEHCAGTELMIGPLFVAAGVSARDLILGLLVGNALAVLSWMLICAPIATRVRLTLYYQAEKICGRSLVTIYNLANGVMFTILAGAMITVSATALGVWFGFKMPGLNDWMPNSTGWIIAVLVMGSLFACVAAFGYKTMSRFANIAAPWMITVFIAFGIIGFKQFADATGTELNSAADLWTMCKTSIWKGGAPLAGQTKFTFLHVMFFAWFCNMAWHIGLSDMSIFRYAKKSWYSIASAAGMYVGHFMAWISASVLYAYQLHLDPTDINVLPGPMTYRAMGITGVLCVIVAGWTTANPTIYRAGLAFQGIMPKRSRFAVTLGAGVAATLAGMFPAAAMKLLGFVALWGMVLMPMGAIIFIDFWLMKRLGLENNYAEKRKLRFNLAAGVAWLTSCLLCSWLVLSGRVEIFFVSLPGWFFTAILYIAISYFYQKKLGATQSQLRV